MLVILSAAKDLHSFRHKNSVIPTEVRVADEVEGPAFRFAIRAKRRTRVTHNFASPPKRTGIPQTHVFTWEVELNPTCSLTETTTVTG